ncbi:IscS subfamily cysteine desulfurase [Halobacillus massiliensis]|uniref:IscS subfamily cysteine desulfurase n=1 Tax=Halobacillus massiliensis TaxID=1926286 RepID=UPI0009E53F00|nr:IscS subfamily cysteine desulfurase [Halobacillus massiliensis]
MTMIYLDHCATTPMSESAIQAYTAAARTYFGNEQSLHEQGYGARQLMWHCQKNLADILHGDPEGIFFTSGGTESNLYSILSLVYGNTQRGRHIITSPFEHPSVYYALQKLADEGYEIEEIEAEPNGQISLSSLHNCIRSDTILVTICHASSETGVIQPLAEIGRILNRKGILFHSDAVQTFAKLPIDVNELHLASLSFSAHKINGPKNMGGCYINPEVLRKSVYNGTVHQNGFRPGTVDVPGAAAFVTAAMEMHEDSSLLNLEWKEMQDWVLSQLNMASLTFIGDRKHRMAHHLAFHLKGIEGQWMMLECNKRGIAISAGSACKSGHSFPPKGLLAMGLTQDEAHGLFRVSFGRTTSYSELEQLVTVLHDIISEKGLITVPFPPSY